MLLYEMLIVIGIAVVLVVAAIGGLAARVGPEEMALSRAARAAAAQHRLVAAAAKQEREARAAAAQHHRLLAAAAQQDARRTRSSRKQHPPRIELSNAYWTRCLKLQYEDALAAPLPARLATLITQLETQRLNADRGSSYARARVVKDTGQRQRV